MKDIQRDTVADSRPAIETNGNGHMPAGAQLPEKPSRRSATKTIVLPILLAVLAAVAYFGYGYWTNQNLYVSTDNAQIAGALLQVGAVNAGRVESVSVDIGERVQQDQVVATVLLPSTIGMSQSGTPLVGFLGTENQRVEIKAPSAGVVIARSANPGDTVAAGQSMVTVVDPTRLWVQAQVEETKIGRIKVGQSVDVQVDSLGKTITGKVAAINRASSATFSLLPASNASGNFTKVTQLVPVKISLDYGDLPLVLGSSVEVHVRVQE